MACIIAKMHLLLFMKYHLVKKILLLNLSRVWVQCPPPLLREKEKSKRHATEYTNHARGRKSQMENFACLHHISAFQQCVVREVAGEWWWGCLEGSQSYKELQWICPHSSGFHDPQCCKWQSGLPIRQEEAKTSSIQS